MSIAIRFAGKVPMKRRDYVVVLFLTVFLMLSATPAARGDVAQVGLGAVISALGVKPAPTDHVVIVDTSASMTDAGRYQQVRDALGGLVGALGASDRVTLITFDTGALVRYRGAPSPAVVAALPAVPVGNGTDIGAGIAAAVQELERADAMSRAAVYLFTDGRIDAPTSPYVNPGSPAWAALKIRGSTVQSAHEIAPYAISLASSTDAALLRQVFDRVIDVPATAIPSHLAKVGEELQKAAAARILAQDLKRPVEVSISEFSDVQIGTSAAGTMTIRSTLQHIPIVISAASASPPTGWRVSLTGLDKPTSLSPGQSMTIPVSLAVDQVAGPGAMGISVLVDSPWRSVITTDLGLTWSVASAATTALTPRASTSVSPSPTPAAPPSTPPRLDPAAPASRWLPMAGVFALLLAVVSAAAFIVTRAAPRMVGSIAVLREGVLVHEQMIEGRIISIAVPDLRLSGKASAVRRGKGPAAEPGVRLRIRLAAGNMTRDLFDGDELVAGPVTVRYTSPRSRMLELITSDHGADEATTPGGDSS